MLPVRAEAQTASIVGVVVDAANHVLPGVTVTLASVGAGQDVAPPADPVLDATVTDAAGAFAFTALPGGAYVVAAKLSGYASAMVGPVAAVPSQTVDVPLSLEVAPIAEVVTVDATTGAGQPIEKDEFHTEFLQIFQLQTDRFQDALPLLPGVVRGPRGRLSFNGTRPSQSTLLVNGANATDPVTGQFAFELPLSVIDTVEVHSVPYSAEYGRVSGAVTEIRTVAGDDHWDVNVGSLLPKVRFRGGTIAGINTATPRVQASGPLKRGRAWVSQAFAYRFVRSEVKENIPGETEEIVEGFDMFTQVDLKLSDRHSMTGTLSVFPSDVDNFGISSIDYGEATPDATLGGWNVALVDELSTGANTLWQTQVALRGFDVAVRPEGTGPSQLTPDGLRGNYFNEINRTSTQLEVERPATPGQTRCAGVRDLIRGHRPERPHRGARGRWALAETDHLSWCRRHRSLGRDDLGLCAGPLAGESATGPGPRAAIRPELDDWRESLVATDGLLVGAGPDRSHALQGRVGIVLRSGFSAG
jgi:hypothetical protein